MQWFNHHVVNSYAWFSDYQFQGSLILFQPEYTLTLEEKVLSPVITQPRLPLYLPWLIYVRATLFNAHLAHSHTMLKLGTGLRYAELCP